MSLIVSGTILKANERGLAELVHSHNPTGHAVSRLNRVNVFFCLNGIVGVEEFNGSGVNPEVIRVRVNAFGAHFFGFIQPLLIERIDFFFCEYFLSHFKTPILEHILIAAIRSIPHEERLDKRIKFTIEDFVGI